MFFFTAGHSTNEYDHGPILPLTCPQCRQVTYWRMMEVRSQTTVYFVPVNTNSRHSLMCHSCGLRTPLNPDQVNRALYLRQVTQAFFDKQISDEEYRSRLSEMRYLH